MGENQPAPSGFLRGTLNALRAKVKQELNEPAPVEASAPVQPFPQKISLTPVRQTAPAVELPVRLKRALIIGGMDFFGAALVRRLNAAGFRHITLVDNLGEDRWRNFGPLAFEELLGYSEFERILVSRARPVGVYSHIFYLADWRQEDSPMALAKSALALAVEGHSRFIALSSASSLGPRPDAGDVQLGRADNFRPECRAGMVACLFDRYALARVPARNYLSLKHYRLFGTHERPDGALYGLAKVCYDHIVNGIPVRLPSSLKPGTPEGDHKHDFLSVAYAAEMAAFLAENEQASGIYEIGSGVPATAWEMVQAVFASLNRPVEVEWVDLPFDAPSAEPPAADLRRLRELGWNRSLPSLADAVGQYIYAHHHRTEELPVERKPAAEPEEAPTPPLSISRTVPKKKPFSPRTSI